MYKAKYYKAPKPTTNPSRSSKPKPQWNTDFEDRNKYKLSESEMIQRKAALQSKNRQSARVDLEERRKKLQMGIIDSDTRKIYETALQSKNIDLNPPNRKNLSQMIQEERERKELQKRRPNQSPEERDDDDFQKQIKETQQFIKKLQKAKKQTKIEKAVDILLEEPKSTHFGPTKHQSYQQQQYKPQDNVSHEEALSNIEETIRFMQMKLFGKKTIPESDISQTQNELKIQFHDEASNEFLASPKNQTLELSHLKMEIPLKEDQEEDECMSTIRRMREMIETKQNLYSGQNIPKPQIEKFNSMKYSESEPSVDFSLTMNEEEENFTKKYLQQPQQQYSFDYDYDAVKKNLFEEVDKLQNFTKPKEEVKVNDELEELKSMVHTTKNKLDKLKVEEPSFMGFDFRGSMNIKKNIIRK